MISYKKINLLDLRLREDNIKIGDELLEIKSPIVMYTLKESSLQLCINKFSESHNLFMNLCGYIDRLFKISEIPCDCIAPEKVILTITKTSNLYDTHSKIMSIKNIKKEGKIICSFVCESGCFNLKNLLMI